MSSGWISRRHDDTLAGFVEHDVDRAAGRAPNDHLGVRLPARVRRLQKRLEDSRLDAVSNGRAGVRVQPRHQVRAERHGNPGVGLDGRRRLPIEDPTQERVGESSGIGEGTPADPCVVGQPDDVLDDPISLRTSHPRRRGGSCAFGIGSRPHARE